jgi:hypothetical protein
VRFTYRMVPEVYQVFWSGMADGEFITDAAAAAGSYRKQGARWLAEAGGVRPRRGRDLKGRCLTLAEREEVALARARGESMRDIARALGRAPSTISRELSRNTDGQGRYRATSAHALAYQRASRPKPAKLATNHELRAKVEADLAKKYSPEQICGRLKLEFPDQPEMQVSTETIYQSLYVQSRGALKQDLTRWLRSGRAVRRPSRKVGQRKNRIPNMINISERPPEVEDGGGATKTVDHRPGGGAHPRRHLHARRRAVQDHQVRCAERQADGQGHLHRYHRISRRRTEKGRHHPRRPRSCRHGSCRCGRRSRRRPGLGNVPGPEPAAGSAGPQPVGSTRPAQPSRSGQSPQSKDLATCSVQWSACSTRRRPRH